MLIRHLLPYQHGGVLGAYGTVRNNFWIRWHHLLGFNWEAKISPKFPRGFSNEQIDRNYSRWVG